MEYSGPQNVNFLILAKKLPALERVNVIGSRLAFEKTLKPAPGWRDEVLHRVRDELAKEGLDESKEVRIIYDKESTVGTVKRIKEGGEEVFVDVKHEDDVSLERVSRVVPVGFLKDRLTTVEAGKTWLVKFQPFQQQIEQEGLYKPQSYGDDYLTVIVRTGERIEYKRIPLNEVLELQERTAPRILPPPHEAVTATPPKVETVPPVPLPAVPVPPVKPKTAEEKGKLIPALYLLILLLHKIVSAKENFSKTAGELSLATGQARDQYREILRELASKIEELKNHIKGKEPPASFEETDALVIEFAKYLYEKVDPFMETPSNFHPQPSIEVSALRESLTNLTQLLAEYQGVRHKDDGGLPSAARLAAKPSTREGRIPLLINGHRVTRKFILERLVIDHRQFVG